MKYIEKVDGESAAWKSREELVNESIDKKIKKEWREM